MTDLTHRRNSKTLRNGHILFVEHGTQCEGPNAGYGEWVWVLNTDLPTVPQEVVDLAADFFDLDEDEAARWVNPENIVDSADAWDNEEFVSLVWETFYAVGYRLPDGAVILDHTDVDFIGPIHETEYYGD